MPPLDRPVRDQQRLRAADLPAPRIVREADMLDLHTFAVFVSGVPAGCSSARAIWLSRMCWKTFSREPVHSAVIVGHDRVAR
jgi:hypothetical protein